MPLMSTVKQRGRKKRGQTAWSNSTVQQRGQTCGCTPIGQHVERGGGGVAVAPVQRPTVGAVSRHHGQTQWPTIVVKHSVVSPTAVKPRGQTGGQAAPTCGRA